MKYHKNLYHNTDLKSLYPRKRTWHDYIDGAMTIAGTVVLITWIIAVFLMEH